MFFTSIECEEVLSVNMPLLAAVAPSGQRLEDEVGSCDAAVAAGARLGSEITAVYLLIRC